MRGARDSLCEKREARCVRSERFARCHAGGSRRRKREVRCARSERLALNRAKTSLLAVSTTHMLDFGRSISHYHFPTWAFTRSKKRARVAITLNRECGSRFFADRAQKRDLARMSKRTPPSRFALARTRSADPPPLAQSSRRNLLRRAKASSILLRERNPKQPAIWRAAFSSKASSKSCRLVNAKFGIPRSWNAFARKASWCKLRSPS